MNNIINKYMIVNYSKILINTILIFSALGVILNLFEEIEFFKELGESFSLPFVLSLSFVPTLVLEILPFIIFLSSMFYFLHLRSNNDLLFIKIFGYSNLKITLILAFFALIFGIFILIAINPIASKLVKFYETERAKYSRDVGHLISVNKNGVWIKEVDEFGYKIINAEKLKGNSLQDISIYIFDNDKKVIKRIESKSAIISSNPWIMQNVSIYDFVEGNKKINLERYEFKTDKVLIKINTVYKNLNTLSFMNLIKDYSELNEMGYSKKILNEKIHKLVSFPLFLFLMVILASIFSIGAIKRKQNYYYIIVSILISVVLYYFKDLSIALGQTEKISLALSVWMPVLTIGLFCSIGLIQINEK